MCHRPEPPMWVNGSLALGGIEGRYNCVTFTSFDIGNISEEFLLSLYLLFGPKSGLRISVLNLRRGELLPDIEVMWLLYVLPRFEVISWTFEYVKGGS